MASLMLSTMFVRSFVTLPVAFDVVEAAFLDTPSEWMPGMLLDAEDGGQHLLAEVGFDVDTRRIDREVEIQLAAPYRSEGKTVLPMTWRATANERLFPHLDADLEIAALGPSRTQLSLSATYRPPLGMVGRVLDRALLHRVAEATMKDFVDRVAGRLSAVGTAA